MEDINSQKHVVHRSWRKPFTVIEHAEGIYLYDRDGNRYIDGAAGSSVVVNIGHGVQSVVDAMYGQAQKVCFAAPHLFTNEAQVELSQVVASHAPGTLRNNCRTWFGTTGTDSVDSAIPRGTPVLPGDRQTFQVPGDRPLAGFPWKQHLCQRSARSCRPAEIILPYVHQHAKNPPVVLLSLSLRDDLPFMQP